MSPEGSITDTIKDDLIVLPGMMIGSLLRIQFEGIGSSRSYLIGMDPGHFLIVQAPPLPDIASKRYEKNHLVVSYLFSGRVYAFRCTLLGLVKELYRFLILSYPDAIETINLRKHERISCIIAAEVSVKGQAYRGIVSDISKGGCSFEFDRTERQAFPDLKVQDEIVISMHLPEKTEETVFNTVVRVIREDQKTMTSGLQFIASNIISETDTKSEKNLTEYLRTLSSFS
jgi:hypothetical protein